MTTCRAYPHCLCAEFVRNPALGDPKALYVYCICGHTENIHKVTK